MTDVQSKSTTVNSMATTMTESRLKPTIYHWCGPAGVNALVGRTEPGRELRCPGDLTEREAEYLAAQKLITPAPEAKAAKGGGKGKQPATEEA